jgi:hypothetical protein
MGWKLVEHAIKDTSPPPSLEEQTLDVLDTLNMLTAPTPPQAKRKGK